MQPNNDFSAKYANFLFNLCKSYLNNWELDATVDVAERTILALADGTLSREEYVQWINDHSNHTDLNKPFLWSGNRNENNLLSNLYDFPVSL